MEGFSLLRGLLLAGFSLVFLKISWKPLHNPRCHGFYRFFAFEGILFLVLLNYPYWFVDRYAPHQLLSWLLLAASIFYVLQALHMLRMVGGRQVRAETPENFAFENTAHLVTGGIYRYVRHPMYGSLLLLAWGAFCKHFSEPGLADVALTSLFLLVAGLVEERENIAFFGAAYLDYRKTTRMFLPFLL